MDKIKIAIVDDEKLIVQLLEDFFNKTESISVVASSTDGREFLAGLRNTELLPEIALLDMRMESMNGIEVLKELKKDFPDIKTIIMSSYYKKTLTGYMLKSEVNAFVPKGISPDKLVEIIEEVAEKDYYFMPEQLDVLRKQLSTKTPVPVLNETESLTSREIEVLTLICQQKTASEIAEIMFLSKRTVEGHKTNLLLKTGAKNTAGLVIYAVQEKLVDPESFLI